MDVEIQALEASLTEAQTATEQIDLENKLSAHLFNSDINRSLAIAQHAEKLANQERYLTGKAISLYRQSFCYHRLGDFGNAFKLINKAISIFESEDNQHYLALSKQKLGKIYMDLTEYEQSIHCFLQALEICQSNGDKAAQAINLLNIGQMLSRLGDSEEAIKYYHRSLALYEELDDLQFQAHIFNSYCVDYTILGAFDKAVSYGQKALAYFQKSEDLLLTAIVKGTLGEVELARPNYAQAIRYFNQSLALIETIQPNLNPIESLEIRLNLSHALYATGQLDEALNHVKEILSHAANQGLLLLVEQCHLLLSEIYEQCQIFDRAYTHLKTHKEMLAERLDNEKQRAIHNLQIIHQTQEAVLESERQRQLRAQERQNFDSMTKINKEFVNNATHDIKNPLFVIDTTLKVLNNHVSKEDSQTHLYLDRIQTQSKKILQLVKDMLSLAKLETGATSVTEWVAATPFLDEIVASSSELAKTRHIDILVKVAPKALTFSCDKPRLEQALQNLISNALKYTPNGGQIILETMIQEGAVLINVTDTGIGIPEESLPFIFDRFYRAEHHSGRFEGNGIGLNIVRLCVEQQGGTISVSSQEDHGTTFSIRLPLAADS